MCKLSKNLAFDFEITAVERTSEFLPLVHACKHLIQYSTCSCQDKNIRLPIKKLVVINCNCHLGVVKFIRYIYILH